MSLYLVLEDYQGGLQLEAGTTISSADYSVAQLQAAGMAAVAKVAGMDVVVAAYRSQRHNTGYRPGVLTSLLIAAGLVGGGGGSGTVTSVGVATANGVSGTVATPTTTPVLTLALGAIAPTSVAATGTVTGSNLSGTNTGDQTNITGNAATATTAGSATTSGSAAVLTPGRTINGQAFDGSADITITAAPSGPAAGDLAGTYPSPTVANSAITPAKMADMATASLLGRATAGAGVPEVLSATTATGLLVAMVGDGGSGGAKGLAPAPGAGDAAAGKYLDASGAYSVPASLAMGDVYAEAVRSVLC